MLHFFTESLRQILAVLHKQTSRASDLPDHQAVRPLASMLAQKGKQHSAEHSRLCCADLVLQGDVCERWGCHQPQSCNACRRHLGHLVHLLLLQCIITFAV